MPYVEVSQGVRLFYQELGEGRPLVLIAGWSQCHGVWERQYPVLSAHYRLLAVDLRGTGDSDAPLTGYTYTQHAEDIAAVLDRLDLHQATVLGWSMGGSVALRLAARHPERLAQVVAVCAPPKLANSEDYADGIEYANARGLLDTYWANRPKTLRQVQIDSAHITLDEMTILWLWQLAMKAPNWAAGTMYEAVMTEDVRPDVRRIRVPLLGMYGKYDNFVPPSGGHWIANTVPNGRVVEFDDSGHMPFLEEPEKFNRELEAFLGEVA